MDLLAGADGNVPNEEKRYIVSPRKGVRFLGPKARARQRIIERRKKLLAFLVEATAISFLIGLAPPFRPLWGFSALFAVLTGGYMWLLVRIKQMEAGTAHEGPQTAARGRAAAAAQAGYAQGQRYVAEGRGTVANASYAGLATVTEGDESVHVIVREG